jgi:ferritin-like metal-binding protein YciE
VLNAALIATAQRIAHYEIAGYGSAQMLARALGYDEAAHLLQQTLDEEDAANKRLTDLAETTINAEACAAQYAGTFPTI